MYETNVAERKALIQCGYKPETIDLLDEQSEKVRKGVPIGMGMAMSVAAYQTHLQSIRKAQKKWWQFWR